MCKIKKKKENDELQMQDIGDSTPTFTREKKEKDEKCISKERKQVLTY